MPLIKNPRTRGDHIVTIVVNVPTNLTKEQKDALLNYKSKF